MGDISRALSFLFLSIGMAIFAMVLLMKIDVMTQGAQADVQSLSSELGWEEYLYQQAARNASMDETP